MDGKMTEEAKTVCRRLYDDKPWEDTYEDTFEVEFTFSSQERAFKMHKKLICLMNIRYYDEMKIGAFRLEVESPLFLDILTANDRITLTCVTSTCSKVFTDEIMNMVEKLDVWDKLVSRDPIDGLDD